MENIKYLGHFFTFMVGTSVGFNYSIVNNSLSCETESVNSLTQKHFSETIDNIKPKYYGNVNVEILYTPDELVKIIVNDIKLKDTVHAKIISNYYDLALNEQKLYGFPTSIKLAQMLIEGGFSESNPNGSRLVQLGNNPFGIKYFGDGVPSRVQKWDELAYPGEWISAMDDCNTEKCKFVKFRGLWHAFRYHSELMAGVGDQSSHYLDWISNSNNNWEDWLYAIERGGYATDENYIENLRSLIESYNLHLLDEYSGSFI